MHNSQAASTAAAGPSSGNMARAMLRRLKEGIFGTAESANIDDLFETSW